MRTSYSPNSRLYFRFVSVVFGTALFGILLMSFLKGNSPQSTIQVAKAESLSKFPQLLYPLSSDDMKTATDFFQFLSRDSFTDLKENDNEQIIIFVSCNWYDFFKVSTVSLANKYPSAVILLSGGRAERLTSRKSEQMGGEPLEMREYLLSHGIKPGRLVLFTGGFVTTNNIDTLIQFAKQEFKKKISQVIVVEESYLVRRVEATLFGRIRSLNALNVIPVGNLHIVASGCKEFHNLYKLHNDFQMLALFWVLGEIERLESYSNPENRMSLFTIEDSFGSIDKMKTILQNTKKLKEIYEKQMSVISEVILKDRDLILDVLSPIT